jgi:FkbM family methyltransferase
VNICFGLMMTISRKLDFDPVLQVHLKPFGVNAKVAIHLMNRDWGHFVEIFVYHVYDKYCQMCEGDVIIDCGAYVGEFAVQASKAVGDAGIVLAFEPNPVSFSICRKNLERNGIRNVGVFHCALGEYNGRGYFHIDNFNPAVSRLVSKSEDSVPVNVMTLSQFLEHFEPRTVKLLKLDVEGFATNVIHGARGLFERGLVRNISAEIHPGEEGLESILKDFGFKCWREQTYLYATL